MKGKMRKSSLTNTGSTKTTYSVWHRFIGVALSCFLLALVPKTFGLNPAPDGDYVGCDTAEGDGRFPVSMAAATIRPSVFRRSVPSQPATVIPHLGRRRFLARTPEMTTPLSGLRRFSPIQPASRTPPPVRLRSRTTPLTTTPL